MCMICAGLRPFDPDCAYAALDALLLKDADAPARAAITLPVAPPLAAIESPVADDAADALPAVFGREAAGTRPPADLAAGHDAMPPPETGMPGMGQAATPPLAAGGHAGPVNAGTLGDMAAYLTHGFWALYDAPARAFDTSGSNAISVNLTALTAAGQQLARWALEAWERVADLRFWETGTGAQINFRDDSDGAWASMSYFSPSTPDGVGRIISATVNVSTGWLNAYGTTLDSYSFQTYIHEIGHALGLGHQGPYNVSASFSDRVFDLDSWQMSVMSYFSQTQNSFTDASYAFVQTPMMADIAAVQSLYGTPATGALPAGVTVWGGIAGSGGSLSHAFEALVSGATRPGVIGTNPVALTLHTSGGLDLINLSGAALGQRLDLRPGSFSDIGAGRGNLGIDAGSWIEHALGGAGDDTIRGNDGDNLIHGGAGNNLIEAGGGRNVLLGGSGNDTLHAGGNDTVHGGAGIDTLVLDPGLSVASVLYTREQANGDGTTSRDGVITFTDGSRLSFFDIEHLPAGLPAPLPGDMDRSLTGTMGDDVLIGGSGDDFLNALAGDDLIFATGGNNVIWGGRGDDTIWGAGGDDTIGGGLGDDLIYGVGGNNMLWGGPGHDTIFGGLGDDTVGGGTGDDVIFGLGGRNQLWGGRGNDTIHASDGGDMLGGNDGDDLLIGGAGNDTLYGGSGNDTLYGGDGEDVFVFFRNYDHNLIGDFGAGDRLDLAQGLWRGQGDLGVQQIIERFAQVNGAGNIVLDFGPAATVIELEGFGDLGALADQIAII